jgi:class I fructose-bisphosphate aldolase
MPTIEEHLGERAEQLLGFKNPRISKDDLHLPGPDFVDRMFAPSDRNNRVLVNLQRIYGHGRLGGTGYVSILPVDQGVEHSGGASFAKNPEYFDPENIVRLALEGGCNAVATTFGVLGAVARRYAHRIPFIVKINHNELLTYPNKFDQVLFGTVRQAVDMGAAAAGATIYFGSEESGRQIVEISQAFARASRSSPRTTAATWPSTRAASHTVSSTRPSIATSPATIPSTSAAIRWPTATWAASASSTAAAPPASTTSTRP